MVLELLAHSRGILTQIHRWSWLRPDHTQIRLWKQANEEAVRELDEVQLTCEICVNTQYFTITINGLHPILRALKHLN